MGLNYSIIQGRLSIGFAGKSLMIKHFSLFFHFLRFY